MDENKVESRFDAGDTIFKSRLRAIGVSFLVGLLLMGSKFFAYSLTQSSAILSDAFESIINVVASAFAMGSIILSAKPPDKNHPYGHGKIEYFSAGFEGALIILAALWIFRMGWAHLLQPRVLPQLEIGLFILLAASTINALLGLFLIRAGKRTQSIVLIADGKHVLTDVFTSAGILLGLLLTMFTGWYWLDGALAFAVGLYILIIGSTLVRKSFKGLMDTYDPDLLQEVADLLEKNRKDHWIDIHELRAWRSGSHIHLDLHLILARDCSLEEAHREAKEMEELIIAHFEGRASVLVHMDPCKDPECPFCKRHPCNVRKVPFRRQIQWDGESAALSGNTTQSPTMAK
jgi:cation diffusion facilitator family transporter